NDSNYAVQPVIPYRQHQRERADFAREGPAMRGREFLRNSFSLFWLLALASVASAETYYVRNGGDDNADGRSHATAWATIGKVNGRSLKAGDHVLFHAGDVFKDGVLSITSSGTSSDRIVIGAYYVENGEAKRG